MTDERLTVVIVDDERPARAELALLLDAHASVTCVGQAATIAAARELVERHDPDVVFLDIVVGTQSGFELLLQEPRDYEVVFVTAFDEYAVRAFDTDAADYLLKPVSPARLAETIDRLTRRRTGGESGRPSLPRHASRAFGYTDRVMLRIGGELRMVRIASLLAVQAQGDFTSVTTSDQGVLRVAKPLKEWELRLPPKQFARVHRASIINLEFVERIVPLSGVASLVWVRGLGRPLIMSRRYAKHVRERLA